jgi:osmotically-inducible protein OsmY
MFNFFQKTDSQIQSDVMNELKWDPSVATKSLTASTSNGIVTLRGTVPHFFDKTVAEKAAQRVAGVRADCRFRYSDGERTGFLLFARCGRKVSGADQ